MWFLDCEAVGEASLTHTHTQRRGPALDWTVGTNSAGPALGAGDSTEQISRVNKAAAGVEMFSPLVASTRLLFCLNAFGREAKPFSSLSRLLWVCLDQSVVRGGPSERYVRGR